MTIRFLICIVTLAPFLACAESNYWNHIEELMKFGTPQGNPRLESYLKDLPPDQMLQAAREYCAKCQAKFPEDQWGPAGIAINIIMTFYGDERAKLSDDRFSALLNCIADGKESALFRETLVRLLRDKYWRHLTEEQQEQSRRRLLELVSDGKSPVRLRAASCREIELAIAENHRDIILSDKNVRALRNDKDKWWNLDDLVRKGEVRLDPETRKALKTLQGEIEKITPTLTALSQDAAESPEVKDRAKAALKTFAELPVAPKE